mgnify:CR=1 FL=1
MHAPGGADSGVRPLSTRGAEAGTSSTSGSGGVDVDVVDRHASGIEDVEIEVDGAASGVAIVVGKGGRQWGLGKCQRRQTNNGCKCAKNAHGYEKCSEKTGLVETQRDAQRLLHESRLRRTYIKDLIYVSPLRIKALRLPE